MGIKLKDIPILDCREKENVKFIVGKFNEMKPVVSKNYSYKKDFKNDLEKLTNLMNSIMIKKEYESGSIFYRVHSQTMTIKKRQQFITFYSKSLHELFLKVCVYCYYKKGE